MNFKTTVFFQLAYFESSIGYLIEKMEVLLEDALSVNIRRRLVQSLNSDERWNIIIDGLTTYKIPVYLDKSRLRDLMRTGMSPGEWLLIELFDRLCSFEEFCNMLEEFDLLEELSLLVAARPLEIEVQPGEGEELIRVARGGTLELSCVATGLPRPQYQWYHNNTPLPDQTSSHLAVSPFSEDSLGLYWCCVSQELHGHLVQHRSKEVTADYLARRPNLLCDLPRIRCVPRGHSLSLHVEAEGYPPPQYEWYRGPEDCDMPNIVLDEHSNIIEIKNTRPEDEGLYCCKVYNEAGENFSSPCKLTIFEPPPNYSATAKVALLIGNEEYVDPELRGLVAPSNDVVTLTKILESMNFHVIALHNLTRTEMYNAFLWFCRVLPKNAYAFFYFAGHGFSKLASKFMMPVDCPRHKIQLLDCLCEEQLTQILSQGEQLQLLVMLFDCCLIESRDLSIGRTEFEHDLGNCNIVLGTATRNHQNAYESDRLGNGMFVTQLKAHLSNHVPVIEVLRTNQRAFRQRQQTPTVFFSGADNCSLADPVKHDPQLQHGIRSELEFPSFEHKLYFSKTNESFTIKVRKHKECFLNSIEIEFPENFSHNFTMEVTPEDVEMKVEQKVVTIYNLQKAKNTLCVTVTINGTRMTETGLVHGAFDNCIFSLDCPIISRGRLWHEDPSTNIFHSS